uniref:Large ribosomal subunit protein bL19c n=1 Tax=Rhizochromulina marina TaxID=1034831 RepID=A0A514CQ32_9STRA|nr:ribosomal protein L19 [Rhizochromulina marina]QDH81905.1 ribosomal protein L19 [Rhizochromulina marina]
MLFKRFNKTNLMLHVESAYTKKDLPMISVGDTVRLGVEIKEGEKIRIQAFEGVVIAKKNHGINKTITVRRVLQGIGVERCFLVNSPKIKTIELIRSSKVRRSKLYYLRDLAGKATRLKQKFNK